MSNQFNQPVRLPEWVDPPPDGAEFARFLAEALEREYSFGVTGDAQEYHFVDGKWSFRDEWDGGEPFSGRTTVSFKGRVLWSMAYFGEVLPGEDKGPIYHCLNSALRASSLALTVRGPEIFIGSDNLVYMNQDYGTLEKFNGHEYIVYGEAATRLAELGLKGELSSIRESSIYSARRVYEMRYIGGMVDLR